MNTNNAGVRIAVVLLAGGLLAAGVIILVASSATNMLGDALCIGAAMVGIVWVALVEGRKRRQLRN